MLFVIIEVIDNNWMWGLENFVTLTFKTDFIVKYCYSNVKTMLYSSNNV